MRASTLLLLAAGCAAAPPPVPQKPAAPPPPEPVLEVPASEAWRQSPPEPKTMASVRAARVVELELNNGLTVWVAPTPTLPILQATFVTRGGTAEDPKDREGLTRLLFALLSAGAGERQSAQRAWEATRTGAELRVWVDVDRGQVTVAGLARYQRTLIEALADVISPPKLPEDALERYRQSYVGGFDQPRGEVQALVGPVLPPLVFGREHPYGRSPLGSARTLARVTTAHLAERHRSVFDPRRSGLILAGAIDANEARRLAEQAFGRLSGSGRLRRPTPPKAPPPQPRRVSVIHRDNSPQTFVCLAKAVPGAEHPDALPLRVANEIMGAAFGSRLQTRLREELGATYGAFSQLDLKAGAGELLLCSSLRGEVSAEALTEVEAVMRSMRERPPHDAEIRTAATSLARRERQGGGSLADLSHRLVQLFVLGQRPGDLSRHASALERIEPEAVRRAASVHLDPAAAQVVLVGHGRRLLRVVEQIGWGPVQQVRIER